MFDFEKIRGYSPVFLRVVIAVLFLWFGFVQVISPKEWVSFLPTWISNLSISAVNFIYLNASFEIFFGILMLIGFYTRISAFLLSLHLFGIAFSIGYNALGVRDFILAAVTFAVFMRGADSWCLDKNRGND